MKLARSLLIVLAFAAFTERSGAENHAPPLPAPRPDLAAGESLEDTAEPLDPFPDPVASEDDEPAEKETIPADAAMPPLPASRPRRAVPSNPESGAGSTPPETPKADLPKQTKPVFVLEDAKKCEAELRRMSASFTIADPAEGEGQCGWPRPLKLTALSRDVKISGNVRVRCELALALARWAKEVVVPSARLHMGSKPVAVEISTSYQCRHRNNGSAGKLSEHAFANGIDLMAIHFEDGRRVAVADRRGSSEADRAFQAAVRGGACAYFTTVLGPVADANHSDHFHFDLAVRRGGYRLCQ